MFSSYGEFYFFARAIINLSKLYFIGSAFACFTTCVLPKWSVIFSLKILNCCTIAQLSQVWKPVTKRWPLQSILRWRCMLKSSRNSNYWLRNHVNHLFWYKLDKQFNAGHFNLSCSPKLHQALSLTKAKFQFKLWIVYWRAMPSLKNNIKWLVVENCLNSELSKFVVGEIFLLFKSRHFQIWN